MCIREVSKRRSVVAGARWWALARVRPSRPRSMQNPWSVGCFDDIRRRDRLAGCLRLASLAGVDRRSAPHTGRTDAKIDGRAVVSVRLRAPPRARPARDCIVVAPPARPARHSPVRFQGAFRCDDSACPPSWRSPWLRRPWRRVPPSSSRLTASCAVRRSWATRPSALRWSGDSARLYFEWRERDADETSTWVVDRDCADLPAGRARPLRRDVRVAQADRRGARNRLLPPRESGIAQRRRALAVQDGDIVLLDTVSGTRTHDHPHDGDRGQSALGQRRVARHLHARQQPLPRAARPGRAMACSR